MIANKEFDWSKSFTALLDKRLWMVFLLGICSGFPWVLIGSALSGWLSDGGISRSSIGFMSAVFFAYTVNFLWSPLIDRFQPIGNKLFGQRKAWIICMLSIMTVLCFSVQFIDIHKSLIMLAVVSFGIAIASATQDIAIDAFRVDIIPKEESELIPYGSAMATSGWWSGYSALGAVAFIAKGKLDLDWEQIYFFMSIFCAVMASLVFFLVKEPENNREAVYKDKEKISLVENLYKTVVYPFADLVKRHGGTVLILLLSFLFTFKMGEAFLGKMSIVFYKEMGYTDVQIGQYSKLVTWGVTILFSLLGAFINMRFGIFRGLLIGGMTMALTNLMFAWIARDNLAWDAYTQASAIHQSQPMTYQDFNNETWAIDKNGNIITSNNGTDWQKIAIKANNVNEKTQWQALKTGLWQFNDDGLYSLTKKDVEAQGDASKWQTVNSPAIEGKTDYMTTVFKKKLWIIGGVKDGVATNEVWSSKDGKEWTQVKEVKGLPEISGLKLLGVDGKLVAYANDKVYSSKKGKEWQETSLNLPFNPQFIDNVQKRNKLLWVTDTSNDKLVLWKSKDGMNWKQHAWSADVPSSKVKELFVAKQNLVLSTNDEQLYVSGPSEKLFFWTVLLDGFTSAFATVTLVSFITFLTSHTFSASQYALLASIANFGRTTVSSSSGWLVDKLEGTESQFIVLLGGEWSTFFVITTLMVLPSLLILLVLFHLLKKRGVLDSGDGDNK